MSAANVERWASTRFRRWTERDDTGRVWLCWYEPSRDSRESRSWLNRTLIGVEVEA